MKLWLVPVAVPAPVYGSFDYLSEDESLEPGCRVWVPFGRRRVVGIVNGRPQALEKTQRQHKAIESRLDLEPALPSGLLELCRWTAEYYHHPLGEVMAGAMPGRLRKGGALSLRRSSKAESAETAESLEVPLALTAEQAAAIAELAAAGPGFGVNLLEGVTGSGKTEVYLRRTAEVLAQGGQVLVLTPEIGLTPQLLERFRARFGRLVAAYHSGLSEGERLRTWLAARSGVASVAIGTRSAVFLPMPRLALIVVDEEHDASFKQQEGLRYSARDVAIKRAQLGGVPVLLGSATPALESVLNARRKRYRHLLLPSRINARPSPRVRVIDVRGQRLVHGLSQPLLEAADRHLAGGGQILMFVNRRGYAPALLCHACAWVAGCRHCDARLILHRARARLMCHHCGATQAIPETCPGCGAGPLIPVGQGTERLEQALRERYAGLRIERLDSDRQSRKGELEQLLREVRDQRVQVLVGTQILAKGHHFEGVSLVGIVSVDQALFSSDFRAIERMGQLLTQVAGRAGRGEREGEVILQTHQPQHPLLGQLVAGGYARLAESLLRERRGAGLPPFSNLALLRAECRNADAPMALLRAVSGLIAAPAVTVLGPVPAPMERRAGRTRAQLLLQATRRADLHALLHALVPRIERLPGARRVRWSIDVDPVDLM